MYISLRNQNTESLLGKIKAVLSTRNHVTDEPALFTVVIFAQPFCAIFREFLRDYTKVQNVRRTKARLSCMLYVNRSEINCSLHQQLVIQINIYAINTNGSWVAFRKS